MGASRTIKGLFRQSANDVAARITTDSTTRSRAHDHKTGSRELNCLCSVIDLTERNDISLEEALKRAVDLIPSAWLNPETACARITVRASKFSTGNYRETIYKQTGDIIVRGEQVGSVEVCRLVQKPGADWKPFTVEKKTLILGAAKQLSGLIERKQREQELRYREDEYKELSENVIDGLIIIDTLTMKVIHGNLNAAKMLGFDAPEKLSDMPLQELVDSKDGLQTLGYAIKGTFGPDMNRNPVFRTTAHDGREICLKTVGARIHYRGRPVSLVSLRPVIEHDRVEAEIQRLNQEFDQRVAERTMQLQAVNKELEAFAYSVSHDLRAPLRSIEGFSQVLLDDYSQWLDTQGRDYLNRVCSATRRMGQLIDDLLNFSRVTRCEMLRDSVDLSTLAQAIVAELQQGQPERQAAFVIAPDLVAKGDSHLLRLALENILGNAWKFTRRRNNTQIEFGCTSTGGETVYFVRDNGVGFDMAYADKLFGGFQRLHSPAEYEGTGIGLTTVQRIIERHGGRIWAESAVDQGATFYFTIAPVEDAR